MFLKSPSIIRFLTLIIFGVIAIIAVPQMLKSCSGWRKIDTPWPETFTQIRSMALYEGKLYVGTCGPSFQNSQIWYLDKVQRKLIKFAVFDQLKVTSLLAKDNELFIGLGTPHDSIKKNPLGAAQVWNYIGQIPKSNKPIGGPLPLADAAYTLSWYDNKLIVGTIAEDLPGSAAVYRLDGDRWTKIGGIDTPGWPYDKSYFGVYELYVHKGKLYAGTFSRKSGEGNVLVLDSDGWKLLDNGLPRIKIVEAFTSYRNSLIVACSKNLGQKVHPIRRLTNDNKWETLGNFPDSWTNASIFNHLAVLNDRLYVSIGGPKKTASVWYLDQHTEKWIKVGGNTLGSWQVKDDSKIVWVYRMQPYEGRLYVGLATNEGNGWAQLWEYTP